MNARLENTAADELRYDWTDNEIAALFYLPFMYLLYQSQQGQRQHGDPNKVQISWVLFVVPLALVAVFVWYFLGQLKARPLVPLHDPRFEVKASLAEGLNK